MNKLIAGVLVFIAILTGGLIFAANAIGAPTKGDSYTRSYTLQHRCLFGTYDANGIESRESIMWKEAPTTAEDQVIIDRFNDKSRVEQDKIMKKILHRGQIDHKGSNVWGYCLLDSDV